MHNILLIDDNEKFRTNLKFLLEKEGYNVFNLNNGVIFDKAIEEHNIDIMITDIMMPGINGFEVIGKCKKDYPKVKIFAITGHADLSFHEYEKCAQKLGAIKMLKKPVDIDKLIFELKQFSKN